MIGTRLWPPASTRPSLPATSAKNFHRLGDRSRHVTGERRGLHAAKRSLTLIICTQTISPGPAMSNSMNLQPTRGDQ